MLACVQTAKDRSRWHSSFPLPRVATQSLRSASCRNRRSSFCMRASDRLIFCIQRQTLVAWCCRCQWRRHTATFVTLWTVVSFSHRLLVLHDWQSNVQGGPTPPPKKKLPLFFYAVIVSQSYSALLSELVTVVTINIRSLWTAAFYCDVTYALKSSVAGTPTVIANKFHTVHQVLGVKTNIPFVFVIPVFPIHYASFRNLSW